MEFNSNFILKYFRKLLEFLKMFEILLCKAEKQLKFNKCF